MATELPEPLERLAQWGIRFDDRYSTTGLLMHKSPAITINVGTVDDYDFTCWVGPDYGKELMMYINPTELHPGMRIYETQRDIKQIVKGRETYMLFQRRMPDSHHFAVPFEYGTVRFEDYQARCEELSTMLVIDLRM